VTHDPLVAARVGKTVAIDEIAVAGVAS
jgi:hypothetical protein